jgi:hypothetical protein
MEEMAGTLFVPWGVKNATNVPKEWAGTEVVL